MPPYTLDAVPPSKLPLVVAVGPVGPVGPDEPVGPVGPTSPDTSIQYPS